MSRGEAPRGSVRLLPVRRVRGGRAELELDPVAVEEPLEIRLAHGEAERRAERSLSVTMRTPGHDAELAAGFLLGEGIVSRRNQIAAIRGGTSETPVGGLAPGTCERSGSNVVTVELAPGVAFRLEALERNFYTTSSCGVCGKASLEALRAVRPKALSRDPSTSGLRVEGEVLSALPDALRTAQAVFERTGGLHAAGLFSPRGELLLLREDVGRHNAVDKTLGARLLSGGGEGAGPGGEGAILLVSGRASFELVQKALMAGVPILAAVGAPSSLAVDLANEFGMTLVGFLREGRFNVYAGEGRIGGSGERPAPTPPGKEDMP